MSQVVELAAHRDGTCALDRAGTVSCWGAGGFRRTRTPKVVAGLPKIAALSMGGQRTCVAAVGGSVHCWGSRASGASGISSGTKRPESTLSVVEVTPKYLRRAHTIKGVPLATTIAAGDQATCAGTASGEVWCWGDPRVATAGLAPDAPWPTYEDGVPVDTSKPLRVSRKLGVWGSDISNRS